MCTVPATSGATVPSDVTDFNLYQDRVACSVQTATLEAARAGPVPRALTPPGPAEPGTHGTSEVGPSGWADGYRSGENGSSSPTPPWGEMLQKGL